MPDVCQGCAPGSFSDEYAVEVRCVRRGHTVMNNATICDQCPGLKMHPGCKIDTQLYGMHEGRFAHERGRNSVIRVLFMRRR